MSYEDESMAKGAAGLDALAADSSQQRLGESQARVVSLDIGACSLARSPSRSPF